MLPHFLLPETAARQDGAGPKIALEQSRPLLLTLGVTRSMEQQSLEVSLCGSPDGERWYPLLTFPQKFYCGTYSLSLDFSQHPEIRYVRVEWKMGCWGREVRPMFGFYLAAEELKMRHAGVA